MADIFVSYAREDLERARRLAGALGARGWSVWWDRRIVAGQTFDQTIERELESARSVVVLWSKYSIESEWTKNEATVAAERGVLVPALLDDVRVPLEFRRKQTANLIDWDGEASHEGFQALCEGIAGRIGAPAIDATDRVLPPPPDHRPAWSGWQTWTAVAAIAAVALVAGALWWKIDGADESDPPAQREAANQPAANPAAPSAASGSDGATPAVRSGPPPDANGIDNPAPLVLGVFHKVTLDQNEDYYFRLPSPAAAVKVVQDMRVEKAGNLLSQLSLLDQHGAVLQDTVLDFNELHNASRKTAQLTLKQGTGSLRLLNKSGSAEFWIAVLAPQAPLIPFFGTVTPKPLSIGANVSGPLERFESAYYAIRLAAGEYRAVVDFSNVKRAFTNLQGFLAVLDADGGNEQAVVRFNEYEITRRKVETFSVKTDDARIVRVYNTGAPVTYALRFEKSEEKR